MPNFFLGSNIRPLMFALLTAGLLSSPSAAEILRDCKTAKQAEDKVRTCTQAISRTNDPAQLERFYLRRGNAYMELKLYVEAKKDFTSLIALNPRVSGYFDNRMSASKELGDLQDAIADANREVSLAPNMAFTHRSRGLLLEKMLDYPRALQDFDQAAALAPLDNGVIIDRARIKSKLGRGLEAVQDLDGVIEREPSNLWAYRERGFAYLLIGDSANAEQDLVFFAKTAPDDEEVRSTLAMIRGRGDSPPASNQQHN